MPWHRAVYTAADHGGDGGVTVAAVERILTVLGADPDQVRRVAAERQADATGQITEDEVLAEITACYATGTCQQAFPYLLEPPDTPLYAGRGGRP